MSADTLRAALARFPRRRYTPWATPLEPLPRFSAELAAQCPGGHGPEVWVKRDDQQGLFPGGNKTRKLEFLVADAIAQGVDTLVTCGAPQSNHCRITLMAAAREGLRCRFVIEERVPGSFDEAAGGNHLLFRLMGVEALTVEPAGADLDAALRRETTTLADVGRRAYPIPVGGSSAVGGLGHVAAALELRTQCGEQGLHFDRLLVATGSGGTQAGLLVGLLALGWSLPVTGIGVSRDPGAQAPRVQADAAAIAALLGDGVAVPGPAAVHCVGGHWQPGYSLPNPGMVEAVRWLARSEGLLLDPVYTGKAMAGLIALAREGRLAGERVLFWHTGGLPGLFAYDAALRDAG